MHQMGRGKHSLLISALLILASAAHAQLNVRTIRELTTDQIGAATANVALRLEILDTGAKRTAMTNANGEYEIRDLGRGTCRLTATALGLKS